jgi:hypothetical protein
MLNTNSTTLRHVLQADLQLQARDNTCSTAQLMQSFQDLRGCESFEHSVRSGSAVFMQDFTADMRYRLQGVWQEVKLWILGNTLVTLLLTRPSLPALFPARLALLLCLGIFF